MRCTRCGGLLIENWSEIMDCVNRDRSQGTRCINCGCIDDPVIFANRRQFHRVRMNTTLSGVDNILEAP